MKIRIFVVVIYILKAVIALDLEIESFKGIAETDPEFMSFGTTRVTKKGRKSLVVSGDFEVMKTFGDEYNVKTEVFNAENKILIRKVQPSCEFRNKDKMTWPQIVAKSNMSKDSPCPFPKGKYAIKDYSFDTNQIPPGVLPGRYTAKLTIMKEDKPVAGYEVKMLVTL